MRAVRLFTWVRCLRLKDRVVYVDAQRLTDQMTDHRLVGAVVFVAAKHSVQLSIGPVERIHPDRSLGEMKVRNKIFELLEMFKNDEKNEQLTDCEDEEGNDCVKAPAFGSCHRSHSSRCSRVWSRRSRPFDLVCPKPVRLASLGDKKKKKMIS